MERNKEKLKGLMRKKKQPEEPVEPEKPEGEVEQTEPEEPKEEDKGIKVNPLAVQELYREQLLIQLSRIATALERLADEAVAE